MNRLVSRAGKSARALCKFDLHAGSRECINRGASGTIRTGARYAAVVNGAHRTSIREYGNTREVVPARGTKRAGLRSARIPVEQGRTAGQLLCPAGVNIPQRLSIMLPFVLFSLSVARSQLFLFSSLPLSLSVPFSSSPRTGNQKTAREKPRTSMRRMGLDTIIRTIRMNLLTPRKKKVLPRHFRVAHRRRRSRCEIAIVFVFASRGVETRSRRDAMSARILDAKYALAARKTHACA